MTIPQVDIDFNLLGPAFKKYVWQKALNADSTIVYKEEGQLIEENPKTGEKKVLKDYNQS